MNILMIGYGKMGKTIEQIALSRQHHVFVCKNTEELSNHLPNADVAIEFTTPESAFNNISLCLLHNIPVVCGTTGWLGQLTQIHQLCNAQQGTFFYSSNFSIGVNLFFKLNTYLAILMQKYPDYQAYIQEIHHLQKRDAPSGTAITLAENILENAPDKSEWVNNSSAPEPNQLNIISLREPEVPGTHTIVYNSAIDQIRIEHQAHSRQGFGFGAVLAAEWLKGQKGIFGMNDLLDF